MHDGADGAGTSIGIKSALNKTKVTDSYRIRFAAPLVFQRAISRTARCALAIAACTVPLFPEISAASPAK